MRFLVCGFKNFSLVVADIAVSFAVECDSSGRTNVNGTAPAMAAKSHFPARYAFLFKAEALFAKTC